MRVVPEEGELDVLDEVDKIQERVISVDSHLSQAVNLLTEVEVMMESPTDYEPSALLLALSTAQTHAAIVTTLANVEMATSLQELLRMFQTVKKDE